MTTTELTAKKTKKSDSTVDRIIDAAEELFAKKSYEGTTLREIAKKVGIREPSIYAHFANKEAIYGAVIDRALLPFYNEINDWNKTDLSLRDLFDIPRRLLQLHADHPYSAQILHKEFTSPADQISPKMLSWLEQISEQSQFFMAGLPENEYTKIDKKKVAVTTVTLTNMTLGFFSSQGMLQQLLGDEYNHDELYEENLKIITRIFKSLLL